jgi:uncharacterized protein YcbX
MNIVGHVDSLWRYPVKSMRGEELKESFVRSPVFMAIAFTHFIVRRHPKDSHI